MMPTPFPPAAAPWRLARSLNSVRDRAHIVVAEDDDDMRRLIVDTLRKDGHEVSEVADGGNLLVELGVKTNYDRVDLLVSDIRMPVCGGLQILEALREARCPTPVILMTAFGDDATRARAESLGAVLFDKPFELDDLRTAVVALLDRRGR